MYSTSQLPMSPGELQDPFLRKALPPMIEDPLTYSMFLLGIAAGMTWALVVMAVDDFQRLVPGTENEYRLAAAYKGCMFVAGVAAVFLGQRLSFCPRILAALGLQAFTVSGMLALCERSATGGASMHWLLLLMMAGGAGQAFSQCTLSGLCGLCPERYMRSFMVGFGASSLVAGCLKLAAKATVSSLLGVDRLWLGSLLALYFASVMCYLRSVHSDVTINVCTRLAREDGSARPLRGGGAGGGSSSRSCCGSGAVSNLLRVISQTRLWFMLMILNWTVTYSVFPGMTADLDSASPAFQSSGWYHVLLMFTFIFFDVFGRLLTMWDRLRSISSLQLGVLSVSRLLFIPSFLAINYFDGHTRVTDVISFVMIALLAVTNGYAVTICSVEPAKVVDPPDRELAGSVGFLSYACGQLLGVFVALGMKLSGVVPAF